MDSSITIETQRLILRPVTLEDARAVAAAWKLDQGPISPAEAEQKISWMISNHSRNTEGIIEHLCLGIFLKDTGELIGWCGLDHLDKTKPDPALFYLLKEAFWGKGLATEAASSLINFAFSSLKLDSIHAGAAPENIASKRVMEKIGMRFLGLDEAGGYAFEMNKKIEGSRG